MKKDRLEGFVRLLKQWKDLVDGYGGSLMELEKTDDGVRKDVHDDAAGRFLQV